MSSKHPARLPEAALLVDVTEERSRGTGPGGQRRNKVQTCVRLVHRPTGVEATAGERRSLEQNRKAALRRLRLALALQHRSAADAQPSELWRQRTGGPKLSVAADHGDVPALVAEALDALADGEDDVVASAARLGVTTSRLLRVLRLAPPALAELNNRLRETGRKAWR